MPSCDRASPFCTRVSASGRRRTTFARQANQVLEQKLGTNHLWYVRNLGTLANLRLEAGDIEKSKELVERAIAILDTIQETQGLLYAGLLNNLGNLDRETGDYDRANELLQRALIAGERLRGPDSFYVSTTLQNLGIVARERKEYAAAEAYEMRALRIRETLVGPDHPDVAQILINLANIYRSKGDIQKSLDTQHRALSIWERTRRPVRARHHALRRQPGARVRAALATCRTGSNSSAAPRSSWSCSSRWICRRDPNVTGWHPRGRSPSVRIARCRCT